jgi:hypothetical protein
VKVSFEQLRDGVRLGTDAEHVLALQRIAAQVLELDQLCFGFDSAVLLPSFVRDTGTHPGSASRIPPLVALSFVFRFASDHPGLKVLIVGHTDTVGGSGANLKLSDKRAQNVLRFLQGDREGWARTCEHGQVRDVQLVLDWASRAFGFNSQPGALDNVLGPRTQRAQDRFRRGYNFEFTGSLKCGVPWGMDDWKAVYDLYDETVARYLGVAGTGLHGKRAALSFCSPSTLACGESWPVDGVGIDNLRSQTNRRVDVLFVEDKPYTDLASESPPGLNLYGHSLQFVKTAVPVEPDFLELRLVSADGHPIPEAEYTLHLADGSTREGKLSRAGSAVELAVAKGPFSVEYGPSEHIRTCALAARIRHALEEPVHWAHVHMVLSEATAKLEEIDRTYSRYFNSLGGGGLRKDVVKAASGTQYEQSIHHLLACARDALGPASGESTTTYAYVDPSWAATVQAGHDTTGSVVV